ncbi:hypothetical protein CSOJ01_08851 [Colletotrichum sojae]|uniref:Uncharacterized protein n=1 Tax=Colletotrichum sojae TaxID=2175907 RepID=A0A8H6MSE1_9PEZI|nr:hypothetical protein CSOJ01_08851 [Colletotrichum sojae]
MEILGMVLSETLIYVIDAVALREEMLDTKMRAFGWACTFSRNGAEKRDCLLRTLLQLLEDQRNAEDVETNWDPITFYVILAIGILAALFTVITIVQAAIAACKGRRKTNRVAIGDWSAKRKRKWSWHELNLQYTAHTPLILIDRLVEALKEMEDKPCSANTAEDDKDPVTHQSRSTATWVNFLRDVGLSKVISPSKFTELEPVLADNLPDGVVAPAYGQVGAIVGITLALGAQMHIQETGAGLKYPLIIGDRFQFEFVSYPILGMIGTYSRYGPEAVFRRTLSKGGLGMALTNMNYGRGVLEFATTAHFDEFERGTFDLLKDGDRLRIRQLLVQDRQHSTVVDRYVPRLKAIADDYIPLISLFWAATPKFLPSLFPRTTLCMNFPFTIIALNGGFWSRVNLQEFSRTKMTTWPDSVDTPRWNRFEWNGFHAMLGHEEHFDESGDESFKIKRRVQRLKTILQSSPAILERAKARMKDAQAEKEAFLEKIAATEAAHLEELESTKAQGRTDNTEEILIANTVAETDEASPENDKLSYENRTLAVRRLAEVRRAQTEARLEIRHARAEADITRIEAETAEARAEDQQINLDVLMLRMAHYERQITQNGNSDTSHPLIDDYNGLRANLEADENAVDGNHAMLHNPAKLLEWFFISSPQNQKTIRSTILEQMNTADKWLRSGHIRKGLVDHRRAVLCNTTMALIQAEKKTGKSTLGSSVQPEPEPNEEVSSRHLNTLKYLHGVRQSYGADRETRQAIRTLESFSNRLTRKDEIQPDEIRALLRSQLDSIQLLESRALRIHGEIPHLLGSTISEDHDYENLHRLLERLGEVADRHLEKKDEPFLWNNVVPSIDDLRMERQIENLGEQQMKERMKERMEEQMEQMDIDDVITYRCLLMALLFQTAQDSSEISEMGSSGNKMVNMGKIQHPAGPDFLFSSGHVVPRTPSGLSPASDSRAAHCPSGETLGLFRGKPRTRTTSTAVALGRERWKESGSEAEVVGPAIPTLGGHALADATIDFSDSTMNFTWDVDPLEAEETCDWVEMRAAS